MYPFDAEGFPSVTASEDGRYKVWSDSAQLGEGDGAAAVEILAANLPQN